MNMNLNLNMKMNLNMNMIEIKILETIKKLDEYEYDHKFEYEI